MTDIYVQLDQDIISKLSKFPGLTENNGTEPSDKLKESLRHILSAESVLKTEAEKETVDLFKGMFIKITRHWAGVGERTEIGLIYSSHWSSNVKCYYVLYIVVEEETHQYEGSQDCYILKPNKQWILSNDIKNLGTVDKPVVMKFP